MSMGKLHEKINRIKVLDSWKLWICHGAVESVEVLSIHRCESLLQDVRRPVHGYKDIRHTQPLNVGAA